MISIDQRVQQRKNRITNPRMERAGLPAATEKYRNLELNPSFEVDLTGWSPTAGTSLSRVTTDKMFGTASAQVTVVSGASDRGINQGLVGALAVGTYTGSAWIKAPAGALMSLQMDEYVQATSVYVTASATSFTGTGDWRRITVTRAVSATGNTLRLRVKTMVDIAVTFWVDGCMLVSGSETPPYFDGSMATDYLGLNNTYSWTAGANSSTSIFTGRSNERWRNRVIDPAANTIIAGNNTIGWRSTRWFGGNGGTGTYTTTAGATDGPLPGISTYLRKKWTVVGTAVGDTGFDNTVASSNGTAASTAGFPVAPGITYTVSAYLRTNASGKVVHMQMYWKDSSGTHIISRTGDDTTLTPNTWSRVSLTYTAPSNAAYLGIVTDCDAGPLWQVDEYLDGTGLLLTTTPYLTPYFDGDTAADQFGSEYNSWWVGMPGVSASILVGPPASTEVFRNLFYDPQAIQGVAGAWTARWDGSAGAATVSWVTADTPVGAKHIRKTWTTSSASGADVAWEFKNSATAGDYIALVDGEYATLSYYVRTNRTDATAQVRFEFLDSTGAVISVSGNLNNTIGTNALSANVWKRIGAPSGAAPTGTVKIKVVAIIASAGNTWVTGDTIDMTGVLITKGNVVHDYFDGSTVLPGTKWASMDFEPAWGGTTNAAISVVRGVPVAQMVSGVTDSIAYGVRIRSWEWSASGTTSCRIIAINMTNPPYFQTGAYALSGHIVPGKTYTYFATVRVTAGTSTRKLQIFDFLGTYQSSDSPGILAAGTSELRATRKIREGATEAFVRILLNGVVLGGADLWFDNMALIEEPSYSGAYFDGSSSKSMWLGATDASESVKYPSAS